MADFNRIANSAANPNLPPPSGSGDAAPDDTAAWLAAIRAAAASDAQKAGGAVPAGLLPAQPLAGQVAAAAPASDAPPLPDVAGPGAVRDRAATAMYTWMQNKPWNLSQAMDVLSDLASDYQMSVSRQKAEAGLMEGQMQSLSAALTKKQVEGERQNAWSTFTGAMVGMCLAAGMGAAGAAGTMGSAPRVGSALTSAAMGVSQFSTASADLFSKTNVNGGQYKADEAKIQKAVVDIMVSVFKSQEDGYNNTVDQARRAWQATQDLRALHEKEFNVVSSAAAGAA